MRRRPLALIVVALLVAGCATATKPPGVDVTGQWTGTWAGHGVQDIPRTEEIRLDLAQTGELGQGRLVMDGTLAAISIPETIRSAAMVGVRVVFAVSGDQMRMTHELGAELFEAEMVVHGDRMSGRLVGVSPYVYFDLRRGPAQPALVPVAAAAPRTAPVPLAAAPARAAAPPAGASAPPAPAPAGPAPSAPAPAGPTPAGSLSIEAPPRPAVRMVDFQAIPELRPIYFDFDSAEIRPTDAAILDATAEWLHGHPGALVLIEGYCDERGTAEYNLALGERRARSTMIYLIGRGVPQTRMTITSYGPERPVCTEQTEACWAENRRAVLRVKLR